MDNRMNVQSQLRRMKDIVLALLMAAEVIVGMLLGKDICPYGIGVAAHFVLVVAALIAAKQ